MPAAVHLRHSHTVLIPEASRHPVRIPEKIQIRRAIVREFFQARLGQPWKSVLSDMAALPTERQAILLPVVAIRTVVVHGKPYYYPGRTRRQADRKPLTAASFMGGYYVCPTTRTLQFMRYRSISW